MNLRPTAEQVAAHNARIGTARIVRGKSSMDDSKPAGRKPIGLPKAKRERKRALARVPEWRVLKGCIDLLKSHPKVAFHWRQSTGAFQVDGRYLKFSFKGASDLMAVMKGTAQFWAIECKSTGKKATDDQQRFLDAVNEAGGRGLCVDDPAKLAEALNSVVMIGDIPASEIPF